MLEYLGNNNPDDVGFVELNPHDYKLRSIKSKVIRGLLASLMLLGLEVLMFKFFIGGIIVSELVLAVYLSLGYLLKISPNTEKMGLFGTILDHPFKYTDDQNRTLLYLKFFFAPGRFITTSIADLLKLCIRKAKSGKDIQNV